MAKQSTASASAFWQDLFQFNVYKRTQGRVVRQATWVALFAAFALGAWRLNSLLKVTDLPGWAQYGIPTLIVAIGFWFSYRLVNYSKFADFLIAVEAEMNKVTWPSRSELIRSSLVVIFVIFFLAFLLFGYDMLWKFLFRLIGVLRA